METEHHVSTIIWHNVCILLFMRYPLTIKLFLSKWLFWSIQNICISFCFIPHVPLWGDKEDKIFLMKSENISHRFILEATFSCSNYFVSPLFLFFYSSVKKTFNQPLLSLVSSCKRYTERKSYIWHSFRHGWIFNWKLLEANLAVLP